MATIKGVTGIEIAISCRFGESVGFSFTMMLFNHPINWLWRHQVRNNDFAVHRY